MTHKKLTTKKSSLKAAIIILTDYLFMNSDPRETEPVCEVQPHPRLTQRLLFGRGCRCNHVFLFKAIFQKFFPWKVFLWLCERISRSNFVMSFLSWLRSFRTDRWRMTSENSSTSWARHIWRSFLHTCSFTLFKRFFEVIVVSAGQ